MSPLTEILTPLYADLPPKLASLLEEAAKHRSEVKGGTVTEGPTELHDRLLHCRASLDRVEEILADLGRLKAKTAQSVEDHQDFYDDSYAAVVNGPIGHVAEFSTGKEREAKYSLSTLDQTIALRKAKRVDREVGAAVDYVRTLFWGIDGTRKDLDTRIRLIMLEGQLEH